MPKAGKAKLSARPSHVRQANLNSALQLMRQTPVFSKADLARVSGISATTMAKLFAQLETAGLIEPAGINKESFGRPRNLYRLSSGTTCILSAVIDIDEISIAAFSLDGTLNPGSRQTLPTGSTLAGFFNRLAGAMRAALEADGRTCLQASVCLPGLIDRNSGKSVSCPNIHWLENCAPEKELTRRLKLPVHVLHEEKALTLAQQPAGHDKPQNFIVLDFSSGVGAGIVCDGHLLSGHSGFAGEIGHITVVPDGTLCGCGNHGCLETVASDRVFFETLKKSGRKAAVRNTLRYQALGAAAAINLFNPQTLYIHTALLTEIPGYLDQIRQLIQKHALRPSCGVCSIKTAGAGKLQGTAFHAIGALLNHIILI